jgi:hypothetical protein
MAISRKYCHWDKSFLLIETELGGDKTVSFGPLSASLSDLYAQGWQLKMWGFGPEHETSIKRRKHPIRLVRGWDAYTVGQSRYTDAIHCETLTTFVCQKIRAQQICLEADPFLSLQARYPSRRKPVPMLGNRTAREVILEQLQATG